MFAFVGLARVGVMVYDVTTLATPKCVSCINTRKGPGTVLENANGDDGIIAYGDRGPGRSDPDSGSEITERKTPAGGLE